MGLETLASLFGGGGGSLSPSSSTAQNTPFYNEAGIYIDSPGAGGISGNTADASATTTPRSQAGGVNSLPYSQLPSNTAAVANNGSSIYLLIFGGLIVAVGIIWFVLKKK